MRLQLVDCSRCRQEVLEWSKVLLSQVELVLTSAHILEVSRRDSQSVDMWIFY
jgi:hypothetical protein